MYSSFLSELLLELNIKTGIFFIKFIKFNRYGVSCFWFLVQELILWYLIRVMKYPVTRSVHCTLGFGL